MDRVDLALVAAVDEVLHHRVADLAVLGGCADHRNRLRLHDPVHLAHDVVVFRPRTRRLRLEVDDDAHVGGDRVVLGREHRVEIHLGDFRKIGDQPRDVDDDVGDGIAVGRVAAAHALEHLMGLDAVQHRERVFLGRRCEAERDVLENLDQHAAEAEGHELAERSVGDRTDDDLLAAQQHLLDLDAFDLGVGFVLLGVRQNGRIVGFDVRGGLHAHHHAARFGLVKDIRGDNLHHNRKAHVGRELRRLRSGLGHALFRDRDAIGIAHQFAFRRRQTCAFVRLDQIEYFADRIIGIRHCLPPGRLFSNWSAARAPGIGTVIPAAGSIEVPDGRKRRARARCGILLRPPIGVVWHLVCQR